MYDYALLSCHKVQAESLVEKIRIGFIAFTNLPEYAAIILRTDGRILCPISILLRHESEERACQRRSIMMCRHDAMPLARTTTASRRRRIAFS